MNDQELFDILNEDFGVVLKRRGLVDVTLMENWWSHKLHMIYQGTTIKDPTPSRADSNGELRGFSWLMVALVTALDQCLTSRELNDLIVKLMVTLLDRNDAEDVQESLRMNIQTNIESWRSTGVVRMMKGPVTYAMRDCRSKLQLTPAIPQLNSAERTELYSFLKWLMAGTSYRISLVSATLYSVAVALERVGIRISLDKCDQATEGDIDVHYLDAEGGKKGLMDAIGWETEVSGASGESGTVPPARVAYPSGDPKQIIETFPCSLKIKNEIRKYWFRGEEAGKKVTLVAVARVKLTGIKYIINDYDECTSNWSGRLTDLSSEHFPVDSEDLMVALCSLMDDLSDDNRDWLYKAAKLDGGINDLDNHFTTEQMGAFLRFQALVFGYWYSLLDPWVSRDYLEGETYFYGVWGYRDTYLLVLLRTAATQFRLALEHPIEGLDRERMLSVLSTMFAGRAKDRPERPKKQKPILTHGMVAILDKVSIVSMSLLRISNDAQQHARFAIVSLPIIPIMPNSDGEVWTGDGSGILSQSCAHPSQHPTREQPKQKWSVHPKMTTSGGRISDVVVLMVRCGGVAVGTMNPAEADAVLLRAQENASSHLCKFPGGLRVELGPSPSFLHTFEHHFQDGTICRAMRRGEIVIVHSYGSPIMRYAAAGFYAEEKHVVFACPDQAEAVQKLMAQKCGLPVSCGFGTIID
ncbi:MAG: hypothetical protein OHK93_008824 [Ramalina farinacea]|uniref:Uncharacterized protein n=1 Tax=Ramalina farinacea TaxID=258253 RepID=A0AA43TVH0_9LECA|nr:hypothetical protein [Ramalina farinacea]